MTKLSFTDLKIIFLGISRDGNFNEKNMEQSDLKKLGVGRLLDQLASLKERGLIAMNKDGSFSITNTAKHILWDKKIPLALKILRLLEIKSQNVDTIASFLLTPSSLIKEELEELRKKQLVLMSPLRTETGLEKFYEILPEGIEFIDKVQIEGFQDESVAKNSPLEVSDTLEKTIEQIKNIQKISNEEKDQIISNLLKIKERLEI